MASYADYTYYTGTFHGSTIASTEFANLAIRASAAIDQATFGRAAMYRVNPATRVVYDQGTTGFTAIATDPAVSVGDVIEVVDFVSNKAVAVGYATVTADVIK